MSKAAIVGHQKEKQPTATSRTRDQKTWETYPELFFVRNKHGIFGFPELAKEDPKKIDDNFDHRTYSELYWLVKSQRLNLTIQLAESRPLVIFDEGMFAALRLNGSPLQELTPNKAFAV